MSEREQRRARVFDSIQRTISNPGKRSAQVSVGPSEIATPCDWCLGRALTRKYPELWWQEQPWRETPSHKAWVGTAMHEKMDRDHPHGTHEQRVFITHLEGYGDIHGHCDLLQEGIVVDYKSKDVDVIDDIKRDGPPAKEIFQGFLYGYGFEQEGHEVLDVGLFYMPRDSNDPEDTYRVVATYNPAPALRALNRLSQVWATVRAGDGETLERDFKDCYPCQVWKRGQYR